MPEAGQQAVHLGLCRDVGGRLGFPRVHDPSCEGGRRVDVTECAEAIQDSTPGRDLGAARTASVEVCSDRRGLRGRQKAFDEVLDARGDEVLLEARPQFLHDVTSELGGRGELSEIAQLRIQKLPGLQLGLAGITKRGVLAQVGDFLVEEPTVQISLNPLGSQVHVRIVHCHVL